MKTIEKRIYEIYETDNIKDILAWEISKGNDYNITNTKLYNILFEYDFSEWLRNQTESYEEFEIAMDNFQNSELFDLMETIQNFIEETYVMVFNEKEYAITELSNKHIATQIDGMYMGSEFIVNLVYKNNNFVVTIYDIYELLEFDEIQSFSELENYCIDNNLHIDTFKVEEIILN